MYDSQIFLSIFQFVPPIAVAKAAHKNEEDEQSDPLLSMLKQKSWMLKHAGSVHNLCSNSNKPYDVVLKFVKSKISPIF